MRESDVKLGKFISLVLRHQPQAAGIQLDAHGWADVDQLIQGVRATGRHLDRETLERLVRENDKQRYTFNSDHTKIRANQGHSIEVDVELKEQEPPSLLYHGTARRFLSSIWQKGLVKMTRQHVHLSADEETARKVGSRHGSPVVLEVNAGKMFQDGFHFFLSENGVWLTDHVPQAYLKLSEETESAV